MLLLSVLLRLIFPFSIFYLKKIYIHIKLRFWFNFSQFLVYTSNEIFHCQIFKQYTRFDQLTCDFWLWLDCTSDCSRCTFVLFILHESHFGQKFQTTRKSNAMRISKIWNFHVIIRNWWNWINFYWNRTSMVTIYNL